MSVETKGVCSLGKRLDIVVPSEPFDELCICALKVLQHVKADWDPAEIKFKLFTDGHTNRLVGCYLESASNDLVLIRVYGKSTELFIDRNLEVANMMFMQRAGLGSPVYCGFTNGLCYGYSPGEVLDEKSVRDPIISKLIAAEMAKMHSVTLDEEYKQHVNLNACIFPLLRKYLALVPENLPVRNSFNVDILRKEFLEREILFLEEHLCSLDSPVVFCHNDLLLKNILHDDETGKVSFIDYEYAAPNYQAFDIGNHFCEYAGLDTYVPELYPNYDFQFGWLKTYLDAKRKCEGRSSEVTEYDVQVLYVQVNKFTLASHMMWGIWAIIQSAHSALDFDFLNYAYGRISEYHKNKQRLLSLEIPQDHVSSISNGISET